MGGKRVVLVGATGMVGGCALDICLDDPAVAEVTVLGRRSVRCRHPKLREVLHGDFMDFSAVSGALRDHDAALYCLGAYTGSVPDAAFRRITLDFTVAFARVLRKESPRATFAFLSGQGADLSESIRTAFARYKGMAENALMEAGFPSLHIFRPGYIYPVVPRVEPNFAYRIFRPLYPVIRRIYPNIGISSEGLARAMVERALKGGEGDEILENRDIRAIACA